MDAIDRQLVAQLLEDGRLTYQELAKAVRLSANTTADRVRRLHSSGVIRGYHAALDYQAIGRPLILISDLRLREGYDNELFHQNLASIPQIVEAFRTTGEYDYQIRLACTDTGEFERILAALKGELGVREVRSRLLLHDIPLRSARILED
ncbi:Lrp/AsnC family transcriptional regulator [Amycolatopsis nigrescens]|uniref:Lrp/AsnC family transcriptional regulator n=1 Tax=Amycolatopsis nigrescens TaxID=381445 RepID=UPI000378ADF5|nr:Lrp/AsnC family transcriptional regulator [Amycolatopsis nigrescens]